MITITRDMEDGGRGHIRIQHEKGEDVYYFAFKLYPRKSKAGASFYVAQKRIGNDIHQIQMFVSRPGKWIDGKEVEPKSDYSFRFKKGADYNSMEDTFIGSANGYFPTGLIHGYFKVGEDAIHFRGCFSAKGSIDIFTSEKLDHEGIFLLPFNSASSKAKYNSSKPTVTMQDIQAATEEIADDDIPF